ncbi:endonuclease domain-containing protein [Microbacterium sp. cx-59]|uniref:endonuclease domain-containing protein n=1 Tax=Microbacterium sp. cx-59 TaxID=2891207 RepID=UPI001E32DB6B|nr:DUF559 domain-containing protein [Microbacterium sp. cx-59]MCC4908430.1 DUF559 domain-containing protein [Microbacterium sp. cx-59]
MSLEPLPALLGDRFGVGTALDAGVPAGRLRRSDLESPFHGVRVRPDATLPEAYAESGPAERDHLMRALAFLPRLGGEAFFSHVTAAVILQLPLPPYVVADAPVHVSVLPPHRPPRAKGVKGHVAMPHLTATRRDGVIGARVTSPATTWAMLGGSLVDVRDVVAAGDACIRTWRVSDPIASLDELSAVVSAGRRIGIERLRTALPLLRSRSASRPETWCRLTLMDAGLEEPESNFDIYVDGVREACVDLAYPKLRIAIEYEGEHHLRDATQWARDIVRYERLAAAGWHVIRVTRAELFGTPEKFVRRVRVAISARS